MNCFEVEPKFKILKLTVLTNLRGIVSCLELRKKVRYHMTHIKTQDEVSFSLVVDSYQYGETEVKDASASINLSSLGDLDLKKQNSRFSV